MAKEPPYETFQFIETSNSNPDMNQLLVLQDDGTLLSVNRDIQYIAQVQDVKEVIGDTCTVFDVSSQEFYVDVDSTSDLIVQEQFAIPNEDGSIYSSSFLLQSETGNTEPMITETCIPTLKPESQTQSEAEVTDTIASNNFTEITLTDSQYHLLEQKGWILLEISGRIYVLDTLGLHDITNDEKLIQKLKSELEHTTTCKIEPRQVKTENEPHPSSSEDVKNEILVEVPPLVDDDDPSEHKKEIKDIQTINENSGKESNESNLSEEPKENPSLDLQPNNDIVTTTNDSQRKCDSIKIKTKYTFCDIPEKIFLGKTVNGKKLYAKITKSKHREIMNTKLEMCRKSFEKEKDVDAIDDFQFINIIQDYIRDQPSKIQINNVIAADTVVTQLMQMAHIKHTVMGNCVVITKTVIFVTADGKERTRRKPTMITGEVKPFDDTHGRFVHSPYMLYNMAFSEASNMAVSTQQSEEEIDKITQEFVEFVHIHITETKMPHKPSIQSINVCNRKISLDVIRDAKKRYPNPIYACGACAAVFKSQSTLKDHLENHCLGATDPDDALTIDTDQLNEPSDTYYMLNTGKEKWYSCTQCEAKFLKLFNCKKHIKSHSRPIKRNTGSDKTESEIKEYKCKMCSSKYFHASSLSKHIVKRHIQVHTNKKL